MGADQEIQNNSRPARDFIVHWQAPTIPGLLEAATGVLRDERYKFNIHRASIAGTPELGAVYLRCTAEMGIEEFSNSRRVEIALKSKVQDALQKIINKQNIDFQMHGLPSLDPATVTVTTAELDEPRLYFAEFLVRDTAGKLNEIAKALTRPEERNVFNIYDLSLKPSKVLVDDVPATGVCNNPSQFWNALAASVQNVITAWINKQRKNSENRMLDDEPPAWICMWMQLEKSRASQCAPQGPKAQSDESQVANSVEELQPQEVLAEIKRRLENAEIDACWIAGTYVEPRAQERRSHKAS